MNLYPVNLNIQDRTCVIVGGGEVASRKIGPLLNCRARVVVISPMVTPDIRKRVEANEVTLHQRGFRPGDLEGAYLVFAATNDREVQQAVVREAKENNIPINSADDPEECTFQVPARVRRGHFLLTVSTGGSSPALAAKLRKELEVEFGIEYEMFVNLLARIREKVVSDGQGSKSHKELFEKLLQLNILKQIQMEDWAALQDGLGAILPDDLDVGGLVGSIMPEHSLKTLEDKTCGSKK